jgi:integrin alpha FG-GAP repeat containing protein 1
MSPLAILTAALALAPAANASWWPFKPKRFTSEAFIDAGSLGLEGIKGRVVAMGDLNADQK